MKKINTLLLSALLLFPFLASAQTFPLLDKTYAPNCTDASSQAFYWTKNSSGQIKRYQKVAGNVFKAFVSPVQKLRIEGNKAIIESAAGGDQTILLETLEIKPNNQEFRFYYLSLGGDVIINDGVIVSDPSKQSAYIAQCDPNSQVAQLMASYVEKNNVSTEGLSSKNSNTEKCYLNITGGDQVIDSCDPETIKNSLAGNNRATLWKFKNDSIIDQFSIFSNAEARSFAEITRGGVYKQIIPSSINYKASGNQITRELRAGSDCFITFTVQEKNGYRKELFKSASPSCPAEVVRANQMVLENLKSGKDKGYRIIGK